ncbi:MAG TPA: glycoside hydrolase [Chloroflexi bacterium]|nr:glycoside hydrolase [Chloroflexota bacterium]
MLKKAYSKTGRVCRVTFRLPAEVKAQNAMLVGDFNGWDTQATPMRVLKNGDFSATLSLEAGKSYRFRYLLDGKRWENDWAADAYIPNEFGGDDSVVQV